jgi:hypothetical protein
MTRTEARDAISRARSDALSATRSLKAIARSIQPHLTTLAGAITACGALGEEHADLVDETEVGQWSAFIAQVQAALAEPVVAAAFADLSGG